MMEGFARRKVVVVGDLLADQFLYGEISRVSREAPVLILRHERTETTPGGAANCAVNLASLGARVSLIGVVGEDAAGAQLLDKLSASGVECRGVIAHAGVQTTTKVRILAGQIHSTRQQVIRVDYEGGPIRDAGEMREQLRASLSEEARDADAVIISDYNYGVADEEMAAAVRGATRERGTPVLVDSRFSLTRFYGFTSATPNEDEVEQVFGRQLCATDSLERAGAELCEQLGYRALLITRGSRGMMLCEAGVEKPLHIEAVGALEPVDVTGAGDTVIAAYTLALASGASFAEAAHLANHAGGLVVMKRGTASISPDELLSSIHRYEEAE
jgi:rfaE bifunctional protein kinase chain/domain